MASNKSQKIVGEICLYGTSRTGAGFIVATADGRMGGTGEPRADRSFTEAVFMGVEALRTLGVESGMVRIFEPNGQRMAVVSLSDVPTFGALTWQAAPVYTVTL